MVVRSEQDRNWSIKLSTLQKIFVLLITLKQMYNTNYLSTWLLFDKSSFMAVETFHILKNIFAFFETCIINAVLHNCDTACACFTGQQLSFYVQCILTIKTS